MNTPYPHNAAKTPWIGDQTTKGKQKKMRRTEVEIAKEVDLAHPFRVREQRLTAPFE